MFDRNNLVCRLFVAYMLEATSKEYMLDGCIYIVNRFYDKVEEFSGGVEPYQRAARRTPLGYAGFFIDSERWYAIAKERREGQVGELLSRAEKRARELENVEK